MSKWLAMILVVAGCGADSGVDGDGGAGGDGPAGGSLTIVAPVEGALFARGTIGAEGTYVAPITFVAQATDGRIASVDWMAEGTFALGTGAPPDFTITYEYMGDGERFVDAVGRDESGAEVARATVSFTVAPPPATDCQGMLGALGVDFVDGPAAQGVPDPVTVTFPLNGMEFRSAGAPNARTTWMMDCELAIALHRAAAIFVAHDVVEVSDYGIYNYRCIDQSQTPPDCGGGSLSMHAYAQAIDIAGLTTSDGTYYSVNDDWVIDPDSEDTCAAATSGAADAFLHAVVCELNAMNVFNIYLTPNYNAAHRNHWHLDLTDGSNFIERMVPRRVAPEARGPVLWRGESRTAGSRRLRP